MGKGKERERDREQICISSPVDSKEEEPMDCGSNLAYTNGMGRLERFSINRD